MTKNHPRLSRRQMIATGAGLAAAMSPLAATPTRAADDENGNFLFVQTAPSMAFAADANRLTLQDVSPTTLFFSDHPTRVAGNLPTTDFVPFWTNATKNFMLESPVADISVLENGVLRQTILELSNPVLLENKLHFTAMIIDGHMPVLGGNTSLFIDIANMPLSTISIEGHQRLNFSRAVIR